MTTPRFLAALALTAVLGTACSVENIALDDTNEPVTVALADHLRAHGPVSSLLDDAEPMSGVEAACTSGVFTTEHGDLLADGGVTEPDDVADWFNSPLPWNEETRVAFTDTLVSCLSEDTLARYDSTMIASLDVQGFDLQPDNVRCVTERALTSGLLSQLWIEPPATSLNFDLTTDRRGDLTAAQRIWSDSLLAGFEGCLGLGGLVVEDIGKLGLSLSPRTKVCMESAAASVSITEGWMAGLTLNEMSDPVMPTLLSCLDEFESAQLVNG